MSIFEASERYQKEEIPLLVLAGKEYGSGSSRDWAAKGPKLLGIQAVIAESYERIHRSNLVGMGILPLQFEPGLTVESLGLTGEELYTVESPAEGLAGRLQASRRVNVIAQGAAGSARQFPVIIRIDTPQEVLYYENGGILPYVLRQLLKA
jgi:aconitate hydratase